MKPSLLSRVSGAAVALALGIATLAAVGAASPASATGATCSTQVSISVYQSTIEYGGYESVRGNTSVVSCTGGTSSPTSVWSDAGNTVVERSVDNGASWQPVFNDDSYGAYWAGNGIVAASALFRIHYTGGSSASFGDSFAPSYSSAVRVTVTRSLAGSTIRQHGSKAVAKIKVTPGVTGKFVMQVKKGKRWKKVRKVTFRGGRATVKVGYPRHGKTTYRIVIPASGGYPPLGVIFWVKRG